MSKLTELAKQYLQDGSISYEVLQGLVDEFIEQHDRLTAELSEAKEFNELKGDPLSYVSEYLRMKERAEAAEKELEHLKGTIQAKFIPQMEIDRLLGEQDLLLSELFADAVYEFLKQQEAGE